MSPVTRIPPAAEMASCRVIFSVNANRRSSLFCSQNAVAAMAAVLNAGEKTLKMYSPRYLPTDARNVLSSRI